MVARCDSKTRLSQYDVRMDLAAYVGKRFALVLTDENEETVAYSGWIASRAEQTLHLERIGGSITLEIEWLGRIRSVDTEESKAILPETDFWIPLRVGPNPLEEDTDLPTGMKWPS
jgi:hypothetical protein